MILYDLNKIVYERMKKNDEHFAVISGSLNIKKEDSLTFVIVGVVGGVMLMAIVVMVIVIVAKCRPQK